MLELPAYENDMLLLISAAVRSDKIHIPHPSLCNSNVSSHPIVACHASVLSVAHLVAPLSAHAPPTQAHQPVLSVPHANGFL